MLSSTQRMKLRIYDNSIRLRLRRSEVDRLAVEGRLERTVDFTRRQFHYAIALDPDTKSAYVIYEGDLIEVRLPLHEGQAWCRSEEVTYANPDARPSVLVEKDFVRSFVPEPDDHDRYENQRTGRKPPPAP
jgi:hypothetical protein